MNYYTWLDEGGYWFMVGLWLFKDNSAVDYAIGVTEDTDWYSEDGEESHKSFMDVAVDFQPKIKELLNQYVDYFNAFLFWVDIEFRNE